MPYKYIGRTTTFKGKSLWEIVGNLKNFGVGRLVSRSMLNRYPEPSYLKILKVETLPNPKNPSIDVCKILSYAFCTVHALTTLRMYFNYILGCAKS